MARRWWRWAYSSCNSDQAFTRWPLAAQHLAVGLVMTVALWEGTRGLLVLMRRLFPRHDQTPRRLVLQTLNSLLFTFVTTVAVKWRFQLGVLVTTGQEITVGVSLSRQTAPGRVIY